MAYKFCCNAGTRLIIRLAAVQGAILKNTRKINPTLGLMMLGIGLLQACGGGGGGSPAPAPVPLTMSCVDGADYQCSGSTIIRSDNGVALTSSGVQVYGRSTIDVAPNTATGLALATGGTAEFRSRKNSDGNTLSTALLLKNLGIKWDALNERPQIIELFDPTGPLNNLATSRVELGANGALSYTTLPLPSDLSFYDFDQVNKTGTQGHYANNRYFPRADPARCGASGLDPCTTTVETQGLSFFYDGQWRNGSPEFRPDHVGAQRLHEDGDIHAGDGPNGTILIGGNGHGVPFPGSKGVRELVQWNYRYSNIGYWGTRDTVNIAEWSTGVTEHNTARTGVVTFGAVTDPSTIPAAGIATYIGFVYGAYAPDGTTDQAVLKAKATVTVDFAARTVVVLIDGFAWADPSNVTPLPSDFTANTTISTTSGEANYSTGAVTGVLSGGLSSRFFGPVASGSPPEIGGTFSLSNASGAAMIGGFIAYR